MKDHFVIIAPCFNEGPSIELFLTAINAALLDQSARFTIVIVDDGSTDNTLEFLQAYKGLSDHVSLEVIALNFNGGHQNAIREGIIYASAKQAKGYIIMDSDGEDDVNVLKELAAIEDFQIVFVTRGKRSESLAFRLGYTIYKLIFKIVIGRTINFGNFSMLNQEVARTVAKQQFFHYAAFLSKTQFAQKFIKADRAPRIGGESKMRFNSLVYHGLKSLVEYSEELLFFIIKLFIATSFALIGVGAYALYSKYISHQATTGWFSTLGSNIVNSLLIMLGVIIISLLVLSLKNILIQKNITHHKVR